MPSFARVLAPLIGLIVAACGGGSSSDGESSEPTPARGFYTGFTSTSRAVNVVILSNGTYWGLYSDPSDDTRLAGVLQGRGSTSGTSFTSSNGRDFNLEGVGILNFSLQSTFAEMSSISGIADYAGPTGNITFTASYDDSFELTPTLAAIQGSYSGEAASSGGVESASFSISSSGAVSGSGSSGCTFTGKITPRTDGNVYDLTVKFNGGVCVNGTASVTGIAVYEDPEDTLTAAVLNSDRDDGAIFLGTKVSP